jgi:hypothetical protein
MAREVGRALLYGIIGGLVVTILAIWAGTRSPLALLYVYLAAFVLAAVLFEVAHLPWMAKTIATFPYEVHVAVRRKTPHPRPLPADVEQGFLDFERDFLKSTLSAARVFDRITSELHAQTRRIKEATPRLAAAKNRPLDIRRRITDAMAHDMHQFARRLQTLERDYRTETRAMKKNGLGLVRTSPDVAELQKLMPSFAGMYTSTKAYRDSINGTKAIMQEGRVVNVSQNVNRAYESVIAVLDRLIEDAEGVLTYATNAQTTIQQRATKRSS